MLRPSLVLVLGLVGALSACDAVGPVNEPPPEPPAEPMPLATLLEADGDFQTFAAVAREIGLNGGATTLAPDDQAFALMSPETLSGLRRAGVLPKLARRHLLTVTLDPEALSDGDLLPTVEGTPIPVRIDDEGTVFLGGARLEGRVGSTPSGPVYRLARVLRDHLTVRERISASPLLSRSATLFASAGVDLSRPGTYFVPINTGYDQTPDGFDAFTRTANQALLVKTFRALVIPDVVLTADQLRARGVVETREGSALRIASDDGFTVLGQDEARILAADIPADGAIIHLIDIPPQGHLTLLERIRFLPSLSSFATFLSQAGVADVLANGEGPFTVFAATNDAFEALGPEGRQALSTEADLSGLVAPFQVATEIVPASALVNGASFPTLAPQRIRVRPSPTASTSISLSTLGAFVDLPAANGRLHLVTRLLNPDVPVFDQLVLGGYGRFREIARRAGYEALLSSGKPVTVLAPRMAPAQALAPGFECRAAEIAGDHIVDRPVVFDPMTGSFDTVNENIVTPHTSATPPYLDLSKLVVTDIDATLVRIGRSDIEFSNLVLADGSVLHGLEQRLRWYGPSEHAQNLPGC